MKTFKTLPAVALMLTLGACAAEEAAEPETVEPEAVEEAVEPEAVEEAVESEAAEEAAEPEVTEEGGEPIIIEGSNGEVVLEEPAETIVVLEWTYAENLLALGVQPAGMADIEAYGDYVNIEPQLADSVIDVGGRSEPNLEAIAEIDPDLIIGVDFRHEAMLDQLENIAPTVLFNPYPEEAADIDLYEEMIVTFNEMAEAVDREEQAEEVLAELDATYEEAAATIEAADLATDDFVLTLAYTGPQAPEIRVFTPHSMASMILEKIGLNNVHEPDQFEVFGSSTFNVEGLTQYEDANYLYTVPDEDNIYENQLADNPVWENLSFVQEDRLFDLGADTWLYGGPLSAMTLVDQVVETLVVE